MMLILTMVSATLLILMTRHRVWLYSVGIGAWLAWSLWRLMALFERIIPLDWQAFNGVLAFLVLALLVMIIITIQEKSYQDHGDI